MEKTYDVIVIGGGVIGSIIAWRLGQAGADVLLLEKGALGEDGASGAAAGMLGAQFEMEEPGPAYDVAIKSRALYPALADELFEETGISIQLSQRGTLRLAHSEKEVAQLKKRAAWQVALGDRAEWLSSDEVKRREPLLANAYGALDLPDDRNVAAPMVHQALAAAARKRTEVREGTAVYRCDVVDQAVTVTTSAGRFQAKRVVLATGAWTGQIAGLPRVKNEIAPVKGQIFALRPRSAHRLTHTVFASTVYLVPKQDGRIVVGASEEHGAGFNRDVTPEALASLFGALKAVAPDLATASFESAWVGFRPGSADAKPQLGPHPEMDRVIYATGHFRNGILLAPITGRWISEYLLGRADVTAFAPFLPR